jgi:hypothetical protein
MPRCAGCLDSSAGVHNLWFAQAEAGEPIAAVAADGRARLGLFRPSDATVPSGCWRERGKGANASGKQSI